jgi:hypothetical protein
MPAKLRIRITAKRKITFPSKALKALHRKISANHPRFDLEKWRDTPKDYIRLRD